MTPTHLIPIPKSIKASLGTDRKSILRPFQRSGRINLCSEDIKYILGLIFSWLGYVKQPNT